MANDGRGSKQEGARDALYKIRMAVSKGIDDMRAGNKIGIVALSEKITAALEEDAVGTIRQLSSILPKDLHAVIENTIDISKLSDNQLASIILARQDDKDKAAAIEHKASTH